MTRYEKQLSEMTVTKLADLNINTTTDTTEDEDMDGNLHISGMWTEYITSDSQFFMDYNDALQHEIEWLMSEIVDVENEFIDQFNAIGCTSFAIQNEMSLRGNAKCPHCGESYYTEMFSTSTAVYYPQVYKDGVNINPDMNTSTIHCKCLNCHKEFDV